MLREREVILNELAQGLRPMPEGIVWFESLAEEERRAALHELSLFCGQARATKEDAAEAIARSGIRPTHTPAVMAGLGRFHMSGLPSYEHIKAFRLLVALLGIADARRRERSWVGGCSHEWHRLSRERDLGTPTT
ncbi:DUF5958 family protein [Streptomyces sp. NPDC059909]|uniref:DUF5958 family protein n=1 Tax=Streptomyces sp. NPDC059909 TaxID=3346998 RepID=UPI00365D20EE